MRIEVREERIDAIAEYARIPIAFEVSEILDVAQSEGGCLKLSARRIPTRYLKNYAGCPDEIRLLWYKDLARRR